MPQFSRGLKLIDIPNGVSNRDITANATECSAIADRLGLDALQALSANFTVVRPQDGQVIHIDGRLEANIRQICVVTLEPFESDVIDTFSASFTTQRVAVDDGAEVIVDALTDDPPEPIDGGRIDLGELVVQHLSLALDPFPRRPDLPVDSPAYDAAETGDVSDENEPLGQDNPFAVLEQWKRRP